MKNRTCRGVFTKNQYREGDCLRRGGWTVCQFKGRRLLKKEWGGDHEGGV